MEKLLLGIVMCVKNTDNNGRSYSLSDTELLSTGVFQEYSTVEDVPTPPERRKRKVTLNKSDKSQAQLKDNQDWERGGFTTDEPQGPTFSQEATHTSPDPLGVDQPPKKLPMRPNSSRNNNDIKSPTHFSSLPTTPRDWVTVEALPHEMTQWKTLPVYIIADKDVLRVRLSIVG